MPIQKNKEGRFEFVPHQEQMPGFEAVAAGGVIAPDLSLDGDTSMLDGLCEFTLSSSAIAATYAGLLCYLRTVPLVQAGVMTRRQQIGEIKNAAWQYCKDKAVFIIAVSTIASFLPGLLPLLSILGLAGAGMMTYRIAKQFYACLDEKQIDDLRKAAKDAGVQLPQKDAMPEPKSSGYRGGAAGYTEVDPLPSPC